MSKRVVLVKGVGSHNGGAELLLRAVVERLRSEDIVLVADGRKVSRTLRRQWGVKPYWTVPKFGKAESLGLALLPRAVAARVGHFAAHHADVVLDASGFAVGDQWSAATLERDVTFAQALTKRGGMLVMLPQAFGPFAKPGIARPARALLKEASYIAARDNESLVYVKELVPTAEPVEVCPDITVALDVHSGDPAGDKRVAIVPNINLVRRSASDTAMSDYARALSEIASMLRGRGLAPFLLVHSQQGDPDAVRAVKEIASDLTVVVPANGMEAKRVLGGCHAVVAGRFHALVSALSQGVPVVAHSWSHKYEALLSDFGVRGGLADPFDASATMSELDRQLADVGLRDRLASSKEQMVTRIEDMWAHVLGLVRQAKPLGRGDRS